MSADKISLQEMAEAINKSGYLIEQRIEYLLLQNGYDVQTSDAYFDEETEKGREIDLTAVKYGSPDALEKHCLIPHLIIECENNAQPIAFFRNNQSPTFKYEDIKISGVPLTVSGVSDDYYEKVVPGPMPIDEYLHFMGFHHYGFSSEYTQYCSFQLTKSNQWIAKHLDSQHDTFDGLIKCLEKKLDNDFSQFLLPLKGKEENIFFHLFYPIIVLQGELYETYEVDGGRQFKQMKLLSFSKQVATNSKSRSYKIDIVTESYFNDYLVMIDKEMENIGHAIDNNLEVIKTSMLENTRKANEKEKSRQTYGFPYNSTRTR